MDEEGFLGTQIARSRKAKGKSGFGGTKEVNSVKVEPRIKVKTEDEHARYIFIDGQKVRFRF
ncbi:MAG: hypothetical protein QW112_02825 [Candidatus Micrarchaeia archaeon]